MISGSRIGIGVGSFSCIERRFSDNGESGTGVSSERVFETSTISKKIFVGCSVLWERGLFLRFGD
jgi:hypothetical protein